MKYFAGYGNAGMTLNLQPKMISFNTGKQMRKPMRNKTVIILFFIIIIISVITQNNFTLTSSHFLREGGMFAKEPSWEGTNLKEGIDLLTLNIRVSSLAWNVLKWR